MLAHAEYTLIFKPGGTDQGPGIYNDFNELYEELVAIRNAYGANGKYKIAFDDSVTAPCTVPSKTGGGSYNMRYVTWVGPPNRIGSGATFNVEIANGATFTDLLSFDGIAVRNNNTTNPAVTLAEIVAGDLIVISLDNLSDLCSVSGATPFFSGASLSSGDIVVLYLKNSSSIGFLDNSAYVIDMAVSGTTLLLNVGPGCAPHHEVITGHSGATIDITYTSSGASVPTFENFAGTQGENQQGSGPWARFKLNPKAGSSPSTSALTGNAAYPSTPEYMFNNLLRLNSTSGNITQTLPSINAHPSYYRFSGGPLALHNYGTANQVTVTAASGDTIDGVASFPLYPGQSAWLISDGVSRWIRMITPSAHGIFHNVSDQVTNYERVYQRWASNKFVIGMQKAGSGTARPVRLESNGGYGLEVADNYVTFTGKLRTDVDNGQLQIAARHSNDTSIIPLLINNEGVGGSVFNTSSGTQTFCRIGSDVNQTSTAGYTQLRIYSGEVTNGSGTKALLLCDVGSETKFGVFSASASGSFSASVGGNIGINTTSQFGGGAGVIGLANATTNPGSNPSGGGVIYCDSGALKYRGSSGTVTTLGAA